ncbi:hypothetical protein AAD001_10665 [Colwelliaceae bacterium 6471]
MMTNNLNIFYRAVLITIICFTSTKAIANSDDSITNENCNSTCQFSLIENYFELLNKVGKQGSDVNDIDNLLAVMHDDIKYIHVRFNADFNKNTWRSAFIRNLNRGFYTKSANEEIRILKSIAGHDHYAVEYSHGKKNEIGEWVLDDGQLVVFGFTDGKISLIKELW